MERCISFGCWYVQIAASADDDTHERSAAIYAAPSSTLRQRQQRLKRAVFLFYKKACLDFKRVQHPRAGPAALRQALLHHPGGHRRCHEEVSPGLGLGCGSAVFLSVTVSSCRGGRARKQTKDVGHCSILHAQRSVLCPSSSADCPRGLGQHERV